MTKFEELTKLIKTMIEHTGSGHYASSMSALEIMYPLFYEQGVTPDRFILSKGHAAPALYAILIDKGILPKEAAWNFRKGIPGHPSLEIPGVLCSSGSLGMGISKAVGLAVANPDKVYHVLVGDGELQEGQCWEALQHLCDNVIIHVDYNRMQYSGMLLDDKLFIHPAISDFIVVHETTWRESNHYLTRPHPVMEKYQELVEKYSTALLEEMHKNDKIIVLTADLEQDFGLTKIKEAFPNRYIDCGISEQHMVSMANGLALAGKLPVCHTFGAFYRRCIDQIYNNCCDNLKIIYVAGLCGNHPVNIGKSHEDDHIDELMPFVNTYYFPENTNPFKTKMPCMIKLMLEAI